MSCARHNIDISVAVFPKAWQILVFGGQHKVLNPLSPHDALKHHFTSLYTDLIALQLGFFHENFLKTVLPIHDNFLKFFTHIKSSSSTTRRELRQQFAACSGWDDNCKFRLERVNWANPCYTGRQYLRRCSNIEPVLAHLGAFWSPCDITRRETNIDADKLAAMTSKFAQRRFNTVLTSDMVGHN